MKLLHVLTMLNEQEDFLRWFSTSKVVDTEGKPLVVYRGDRPNLTRFGDHQDDHTVPGNIFFTDHPEIGRRYMRNPDLKVSNGSHYLKRPGENWADRIDPEKLDHTHGYYRCYLRLINPLIMNANGAGWDEIPVPMTWGARHDVMSIDYIARKAKRMGRDGLIVHDVVDQHGPGSQYVAFSPDQVRMIK